MKLQFGFVLSLISLFANSAIAVNCNNQEISVPGRGGIWRWSNGNTCQVTKVLCKNSDNVTLLDERGYDRSIVCQNKIFACKYVLI
ncbi:hypothetical protein PIROE2DRAFT_6816 [Piromyces sp. E2]|nr:hypothetical protein PIROE2DRAFT_6816 [Piromyces sp. E2]|eukprot:OUM66103.1 hypothetical protein PIROE2DRAFT_6816 [Piromyces sp. E2]